MSKKSPHKTSSVAAGKTTHLVKNIALLMIGSELLDGRTLDTNSAYLISELTAGGLKVDTVLSCGDNQAKISLALRYAIEAASVVIISGGLGPTTDDLTREAVAEFIDAKLILHGDILGRLEEYFRKKKRAFDPSNCKQALFPEHAVPINNPVGSAPGFFLKLNCCDDGRKIIVSLPGIPRELKAMVKEAVLPMLTKEFGARTTFNRKFLRVFGVPESVVGSRVEASEPDKEISIAYRAHFPEIEVVFSGSTTKLLQATVQKAKESIGSEYIYSDDTVGGMERALHPILVKRKLTIATAESCSGGLLGHMITNSPGASNYYLGGVVTYSNDAKVSELDVPSKILRDKGAVSGEVAQAMAAGARKKFKSKLALSITGIAGPGGGSENRPVGLFFVGIATPQSVSSHKFFLSSNRESIRLYSAWMALDVLRRYLLKLPINSNA